MKTTGIPNSHGLGVDVQFLQVLVVLDERVTEAVRAAGCPSCGGRLDRADYPRKPRSGGFAAGTEGWCTRLSLCCSRDGCRKRATPPSVRFLGRRVYVEVVVILASIQGQLIERAGALRRATGIPARTVRRWLSWWQSAFLASAVWQEACARLVPSPDPKQLPASLLGRFSAGTALVDMGRFLGPLTTGSVPDGSRFMLLVM